MIRGPPRSTRTDTLCPYTTLFRSIHAIHKAAKTPEQGFCLILAGIANDHRAAATQVQPGNGGFVSHAAGETQYIFNGLMFVLVSPDPQTAQSGPKCCIMYSDDRFQTQFRIMTKNKLIRPEERRVGKECVSTCRSRGAPDH